jgi:hypothetical protein
VIILNESTTLNFYSCCGLVWVDLWDCECDDKCPDCGHEIEPFESQEVKALEQPLERGEE